MRNVLLIWHKEMKDTIRDRRTLLVMVENLARDETQAGKDRRMPSTRELARRIAAATRPRGRNGISHRGL